jgi:hypothetical protein
VKSYDVEVRETGRKVGYVHKHDEGWHVYFALDPDGADAGEYVGPADSKQDALALLVNVDGIARGVEAYGYACGREEAYDEMMRRSSVRRHRSRGRTPID